MSVPASIYVGSSCHTSVNITCQHDHVFKKDNFDKTDKIYEIQKNKWKTKFGFYKIKIKGLQSDTAWYGKTS